MKEIQEAARTVPVMAETEVLVVGSGPGGLAAALACARQGAETMLVERFGCFGGNITQAGVETIAWYRHPETIEAGGIGMEFERRAVEMKTTCSAPISQSLSKKPKRRERYRQISRLQAHGHRFPMGARPPI